jgi:hypothetical protein
MEDFGGPLFFDITGWDLRDHGLNSLGFRSIFRLFFPLPEKESQRSQSLKVTISGNPRISMPSPF